MFVIHLPHQAANSSFVGFQGDPWISVHIDDLRPTSASTIMPYEAMGTAISQLFMGGIIPDGHLQVGTPMDQGSAADEEDEESDIEMDSRPSRKSVKCREEMVVLDIEDEGESMDEDEMPPNEEKMSEGSGPEESEGERMEEETANGDTKVPQPTMTLLPPQCQRLHGCIQAAASKLQDDNKRRATQRVEILVNLVPKDIQFPLGNIITKQPVVDYDAVLFFSRYDHLSWNPCAAYFQCIEAERPCMGGRQGVGPQ